MRLSIAKKIFIEAINHSFNFDYENDKSKKPISLHLEGSMGIGKTGLRMPDGDSMKVLRPDWIVTDEEWQELKAQGYKGILYVFDELPQAPVLNMNIYAQICDEYRVGEYHIDRSH